MVSPVIPQLVANDGTRALRQAIANPERFACEPKVDGVRGVVIYQPGRVLEMRNRRGEKRDCSEAMPSRQDYDASAIACRTSGKERSSTAN